MQSTVLRRAGVCLAAILFVAGCSGDGEFVTTDGGGLFGGSPGGGGSGGGGGGGSGGGGGGGGGSMSTPRLAYQLADTQAGLFDLLINGSGTISVFVSNEDPFGTNPDGNEQIFALDIGNRALTQITDDPEDGFVAFNDFDITDNGDAVVFVSRVDITGNNTNVNNSQNVFIAATDGSAITQVTFFANDNAADPEVSGTGGKVVFTSQSNDTGGNPMNFVQLFSINPDGSDLTQITTGNQAPGALAFADNGSIIAFESVADPFGTNADGSREIFVVNPDGTGHMQITNTDGDSFGPKLSDDGARVVYSSPAEHVAGGNPDGSSEVYVAFTDGTGVTQITNSTRNSGVFNSGAPRNVDISGSGIFVAFGSSADLTGDNPTEIPTVFWSTFDGVDTGQYLREDTVPAGTTARRADNPHLTNDGQGLLFDTTSNYSDDASGNGDKIFTHIRQ